MINSELLIVKIMLLVSYRKLFFFSYIKLIVFKIMHQINEVLSKTEMFMFHHMLKHSCTFCEKISNLIGFSVNLLK